MPRRLLIPALALLGLIVAVLLLAQVSIDPTRLPDETPTDWWWSGGMPLLAGSALPPLVGIALVVATRRLLPSLAAGVFVAAVLAGGPSLLAVLRTFFVDYLWGAVWDPFHAAILVFTATLIGLVKVASRSGGTRGVVDAVMRHAKGIRGARLATAVMGLAVFFDDYANTAVVGPTMRPLFDRLKLSREKLAYIIDSTAAPVAGLAIISTWVGMEVGCLQEAANTVGLQTSGYALFFSALGYRFYCVFALGLVFILAGTGRDFGPMLRAERRALTTGQVLRPGAKPLSGGKELEQESDAPPRWYNVVVPIGTVLAIIVVVTYLRGAPEGAGLFGVFSPSTWQQAFITSSNLMDGNFLTYLFAVAALTGSVIAIVMPATQKSLSIGQGALAWLAGVRSMLLALAVLVLAWALAQGCKDLATAKYVGAALHGISAAWVPLVVFLVAAAVAFATGTSWGTMAILIPTAGAVGYHAGGPEVMVMAMAAVLDGAIFGDHCSPISDTTVLSSICSGCDHIDHVRTQIPYAMLGGLVAAVCGYLLVGALGAPLWLAFPTGAVALFAFVRLVGKPALVEAAAAAG